MENTIKLLVNDYIDDDYNPSRQLAFTITKECLMDYLTETEDDRTVEEFMSTYDSDESEVIYEYATDDNRILSEEITYCDIFIREYNDYIENTYKKQKMTAEDYYWFVYKG